MPQLDLAAAPALLSEPHRAPGVAAIAAALRLRLVGGAGNRTALARLLSDFGLDGGSPPTALAVWSDGASAAHRRRAARSGLPFLTLGTGLLRAPPRGRLAPPLLSLTALGLAGPASAADRLDPMRLLADRGWEDAALLARAATARQALVAARVGGSWWAGADGLPAGDGLAIVDTTGGSAAVQQRMLAAALAAYPADRIVLLAPQGAAAAAGCTVLRRPLDPWAVIARAERFYTAGGETGFLALLAGRAVHCFEPAFYAGWGVTQDDAAVPQQSFRRTAEEIFAGACLLATRCRDPYRDAPAEFEDILDILAEWRRVEDANRRIAACLGMSFWKRRRLADFLGSVRGAPVFRRRTASAVAAAAARGGAVAVWASRMPPELPAAAARCGVPVVRVEDGFVRSVGLGADFLPPASLALDWRGAHYDPSRPSDLEVLLRDGEFDARLLERARRLIEQLVAGGITKYNLGAGAAVIDAPAGRRRILVPGQVEDDLSVRLAGGDVSGNLDLLRRVRAANPDAFLLYKPHPDVEAGHRRGAVPDAAARRYADAIVRDASIPALLAAIDEVHTLTSLAGFEALLRRRPVTVYGHPFYAGWGLTHDIVAPFRGRRLSLEELVAGALIRYPRYLDPVTRLPCGPEIIVERLAEPGLWRPGPLVVARRLQGAVARRWRRPAPAG